MSYCKNTPILTLALTGLVAACSGDEVAPVPIVDIVEASSSECPNGGRTVLTGVDLDRDGALSDDEIDSRTSVCEGAGGQMGGNGDPGTDALVRTTQESAGDNCAAGGVRIDVGADGDGDGTLDDGEIEATSYVCNGPSGQDGLETLVRTSSVSGGDCEGEGVLVEIGLDADRSGALDDVEVQTTEIVCSGDAGRASLVVTTPEPAGANCAVGGLRVDSGLDQDRDGVLAEAEIEATAYVCDPVRTLSRVVVELAGSSTVCATGGSRVETGADVDGDGVLGDAEVQETSYVCNGVDGQRSLVTTTPEPMGMNCANGGQRIDAGVDTSGDGALQPSEVLSTTYACNGGGGANGGGGNAVRVASEPAGNNCPAGGTRIQTGPDTNGNGVLDDAEVTNTAYACDGAATPRSLVSVVPEPAGNNCPNGGQRIDVGVDDNTNGTLDVAEIDTTTYVCDSGGTGVPFAVITQSLPNTFTTVPYSQTLEATGGTGGAYMWSISAGSLPAGLTLDPMGTPSTTLSGTATSSGTFTFTVLVTDFFGQTASRDYTLSVTPPPCGPGLNGAIAGTQTDFTVPTPNFSGSVRGMAADSAPGGWVYFVEPGIGFNRFRKDGSVKEDDLEDNITGLAAGDVGYEMDIDGNNIYLTSDDTSCDTMCVYRVSNDAGASFVVQDLADFTTLNGTNDDLRGIHVAGTTMYVITHDSIETELYSINLAGPLPAVPTRLATFADLEYCSGLDGDANYLYTVCDDVDGGATDGVARIDLATLTAQVVLRTPTFFTVGTDIISGVFGEDLDGDSLYDIMYLTGDGGDDLYLCAPSAPVVDGNAFNSEWLTGFTGDDEGMAFDPVNGALYKVDESSVNAVRFQ